MRQKFVAGNWKMFTTASSARQLAQAVVEQLGSETRVRVALCPPFPYLLTVAEVVRGSRVLLGAQNVYPEKEGAFTGGVSPTMLLDVGCEYVIIGHSECRYKMGESDQLINRKVHVALAAGLKVIVCIGEQLEERQANQTWAVLGVQLASCLSGLEVSALERVTLAYEPIWAIGTGQHATPEQAEEVALYVRKRVGQHFGEKAAQELLIQYGGSVTPANAPSLMQLPDIDGGLVGGASLKADQFVSIVRAAL